MKKLLSLSLAMLLAISMIGCGSSEESSSATSDSQSATSDAPATKVIDIDLTEEEYAFGVDKDQPELLEQVNDFKLRKTARWTKLWTNISAAVSPRR